MFKENKEEYFLSKKIISVIMSLIVATSLIGCQNLGGTEEKKPEKNSNNSNR